jgi:hypothetical protein
LKLEVKLHALLRVVTGLGWGGEWSAYSYGRFSLYKKQTVSVYQEVVCAIDLASKRGDIRKQKPLAGRNAGVQHDEITIRKCQQHSRRILHVIKAINNCEEIIVRCTKENKLFYDKAGSRSSSAKNK